MKEKRYAGKTLTDEDGNPVVRQKQDVIRQKNEEISQKDLSLEAKTLESKRLQLQIQEFINAQNACRMRFTKFEKENTSSGVEYLFYGSDGRNYYRQSSGNVYSSDASNIPNLSQCREKT